MYILFKSIKFLKYKFSKLNKKYETKFIIDQINKNGGSIGIGSKFGVKIQITGLRNLKIGNNVHIGSNAFMRSEGGISIGDNTIISRNVIIYSQNHEYEGESLPFSSEFRNKPVTIEKNVWIGTNVLVLPGTYIEEGAVIGMGVVVHGRVRKCQVIVNSSMKQLKFRDKEHYEHCVENELYSGEDGVKIERN